MVLFMENIENFKIVVEKDYEVLYYYSKNDDDIIMLINCY